jgi:thiol-disulfide isomerase/thioredoxin
MEISMSKESKNRKIKNLFKAVLFLFFLFAISFSLVPGAKAGVKKASDFDLRVLNPVLSGYKDFRLGNFKDHVVIINFWATWCPPCRHEIPMLEKFYKAELANGVIVVGINVNNSLEGVRSFVKQYNIAYPVVYASSGVISDYGGVNEIPQTFFISKSGRIMFHWVGEISDGALYGITDKLLKMN